MVKIVEIDFDDWAGESFFKVACESQHPDLAHIDCLSNEVPFFHFGFPDLPRSGMQQFYVPHRLKTFVQGKILENFLP